MTTNGLWNGNMDLHDTARLQGQAGLMHTHAHAYTQEDSPTCEGFKLPDV